MAPKKTNRSIGAQKCSGTRKTQPRKRNKADPRSGAGGARAPRSGVRIGLRRERRNDSRDSRMVKWRRGKKELEQ